MKLPLCLAAAALLSFAAPASAGVTHNVNVGPGFSFGPANLSIDVGDTVLWTWVGGFHDVESGTGGVPDGNFDSGAPTSVIGTTYSVTFDLAFLAANPMPGDLYPYYCAVHVSFGQVGNIQVNQVPSGVLNYGACNSTAGSLQVVSGAPVVGTVFTIAAHDTSGTSPSGATAPLLLASLSPDPNFPCGTPIPGFGMAPPGGLGDLLIGVTPPNPLVQILGGIWSGAPVDIALPMPNDSSLLGVSVYLQAIMASAGSTRFTEGMRITIGSI